MAAALTFATAPLFWYYSLVGTTYPVTMFLLALVLLLVLRWEEGRRLRTLAIASLILGLSLGVHIDNLFFLSALAVFVHLTDRQLLLLARNVLALGLPFAGGGRCSIYASTFGPSRTSPYKYFRSKAAPVGWSRWYWFVSGE